MESFIEERKRYIGFSDDDAALLASLAPVIEPHLPSLAERFYEAIPRHPSARSVFTGGDAQIARLKLTLQQWARGLSSGVYDDAYAQERCRIGYRHVQIRLPQRYVISAMHIVAQFLRDVLDREIHDEVLRSRAHHSLSRIIILDLNLICETYFEGSLREQRMLNDDLAATNEALERVSKAKTEFLATVSHELRTPLTSIIGFSKLLADNGVPDPDAQREFARDVHASSLALLSLVDEILDVARIEAGKLDVGLEQVEVRKLAEEAIGTLRIQAERKSLTLTADVPADLPAIGADRTRLRQVLVNILGNAIKFTDEGSVWLTARADEDAGRLTLIVRDTGIGIAAEHQQGLFEKFRQVDSSCRRRHGGLGLGLAISKALVERMGGSIELRSEGFGTGTTVTITIPMLDALRADRPRPQRPPRARPTVLLVAQDPRVRKAMATVLAGHGYVVKEGATADGARAMARADVPDVLLLDLTAATEPSDVRTWLDLLVELQGEPETRSIKVLVLTDATANQRMHVHLELVAAHSTVIQQPVDADGLQRAIGRIRGIRPRLCRVLVADDDPLVFRFVEQLLPPAEYSVLHAPGGKQALAMLQANPFDVLLLDLRMPDGSGYEVIQHLTLESRLSELPTIVITNFPEPGTDEERNLLGLQLVVELLPKTAVAEHPELLLDRLEQIRSEL